MYQNQKEQIKKNNKIHANNLNFYLISPTLSSKWTQTNKHGKQEEAVEE